MNTQFEQVAFRSQNIRQHTAELTKRCGAAPWIHDTVNAVHLFAMDPALGETFQVDLAFNYTLLPNTELELIQLRDGRTVQLDAAEEEVIKLMGAQTLSHLGYHLLDMDEEEAQEAQMRDEMQSFIRNGYPIVQLSQTIAHSGTKRRYRYAFADTRVILGTYTKVIQRLSFPSTEESLARGREVFTWLNDQK